MNNMLRQSISRNLPTSDTMSFRIQRLVRAQRLLPQATRRFASTQAHEKPIHNTPPPEASSVEPVGSTSRTSEILEAGREALRTAETTRVTPHSPLHPILAEGYVYGGVLQRSNDSIPGSDENLCPKWGTFGVPIKVHGLGGTSVVDLPNFWLRDNCRCATCVNQDTLQRAFDTFAFSKEVIPEVVTTEKEGLKIACRVSWIHGFESLLYVFPRLADINILGSNDGHISTYPWDWIFRHAPATRQSKEKPKTSPYKFWDSSIAADPPTVSYDEVMASDAGVGKMLAKIREYGFTYVDGCPISPEKTQELLERIAFIRVTHYGGFYDFTADLTMKDTAYTNLALPAHTDNTYFSDPSGLQAFHLLSHTEGGGGESLLVDGFNAASTLLEEDSVSYNRLAAFPIPWHASGNEGTTIVPFKKFPVFEFGDSKEGAKTELTRVRWNNDDRGVVDLRGDSGITSDQWYEAAREWNGVLRRKNMEYWSQLKPGRPLIFDNWRVLHGRAAFTGKRRMCGGYINRDDYISRWRNTNFTREEALSQIL